MGDGELAGDLTFPPASLADPELARAAAPEDWYRIVTNGNLDRLMPPFPSLSDQQRWDVVGYALSLSIAKAQLQTGGALFAQACAECHTGADFGAELYRSAARNEILAVTRDGLGSDMPPFAGQLTDDQLWAVAGYVQSQAWRAAPQPEAVAEQPVLSRAAVEGQISNGTAGASIPAALLVTIMGFDSEQQVVNQTVTADAEGRFGLEPIEAVPGRLFFATLEYQDVRYRSELAHAPSDGGPLELPITIYETTSDLSSLRVERLHLLIDFPEPGVLRVLQLWVVGNPTDRVLAPGLRVSLPASTLNLTFEEGQLGDRFERTASGFIDHEPVPPGSAIDQLVFAFDLIREGRLDYQQPLQHPVQAITVLVPADGPRLSGLIDEGVRDLGGLQMHSYAVSGLAAGDSLSFHVAGPSGVSAELATTVVGAAALLIAGLIAIRSWPGRGAGEAAPETSDEQTLLRAIAQLDADYEAGQLSVSEYERRRQSLKQQALERMRGARD